MKAFIWKLFFRDMVLFSIGMFLIVAGISFGLACFAKLTLLFYSFMFG